MLLKEPIELSLQLLRSSNYSTTATLALRPRTRARSPRKGGGGPARRAEWLSPCPALQGLTPLSPLLCACRALSPWSPRLLLPLLRAPRPSDDPAAAIEPARL